MNEIVDQYLTAYIEGQYACTDKCKLFKQGSIVVPHLFTRSIDVICRQCGRMFTHEEAFGEDKGWATSWEIEENKNERLALDSGSASE